MDEKLLPLLETYVRSGALAVGITEGEIQAGRGTVVVGDTGVDIWWADNALGTGRGGWQIRETYHAIDLMSGGERVVTNVLETVRAEDVYNAARSALLAAAERRVEAALSELAAAS